MATATSLTKERILELAAGWDAVQEAQDVLTATVEGLSTTLQSQQADLNEFNNTTLPNLQNTVSNNDTQIQDIKDNAIPDMQAILAEHDSRMDSLDQIQLPAIVQDLSDVAANAGAIPQIFFADDPPENTDDRDLQINDVWYDKNDGYKQYNWDGTEWMPFNVDIPDLSLTVKKFKTESHEVYTPLSGDTTPMTATTKGANIS